MRRFLEEVTARTERRAVQGKKRKRPAGIDRLGLRVPDVRALVKEGYSFYEMPDGAIGETWDYIWRRSHWHEVMSQALYFYQAKPPDPVALELIRNWIERCHCWEHSDDLSKIYAGVVEEQPQLMLPTLRRWNRSANPWERRQSVVSLIEYARKRRRFRPFEELISFVRPLLDDDDYYVQKGVGWTLREIYNAYPAEGERFIRERVADIHPLAWSAATEKLEKRLKARLNASRREARAASKE